ncbi:histidine ammonia-lyase, partial [Candidatus Uhrbacteria bacterium]|nr:histidine ammonia-lyase [Candidatus Uhrbacteria bacterium]
MEKMLLGPDHTLTINEVARAASEKHINVRLTAKGRKRVERSRAVIERMVAKRRVVYGVTTGFGSFKDKAIRPDDIRELQRNLIRSHSAGVGEPLAPEFARATLLVRLNSLVQGYSGVRIELLDFLCEVINRGVTPVAPSQGSVGSSGDLAPLSHMALVLMGEGEAWYRGKRMTGGEALKRTRIKPIAFEAKEGLAWNNGTAVMTGIAALAVHGAQRLADAADAACALTLEAICGSSSAFDRRVHALRQHPGQVKSAENIRRAIAGSKLVDSGLDRVQDSYSLRCAPQVHGACRDALAYAAAAVERELNSVTDNPLIFEKPDVAISGGNFHGEPIAIAMDTLGIAIAELANISERRTAKLVDAATSEGLPMFLIAPEKAGLHSGLMVPQYTAAALVSENKVLAHPASVDSIPTSANQEDHVSMGTIAARKAWLMLENTWNVIAIEYLTATQAIDFRNPQKLGAGTKKAYQLIRRRVPHIASD